MHYDLSSRKRPSPVGGSTVQTPAQFILAGQMKHDIVPNAKNRLEK